MNKLDTLTASELVVLFNKLTGSSVKRFADRAAGLKRINKLLASDPAMKQKADALLGLKFTAVEVVPADQPIPTVEEAFQEMPEVKSPKNPKLVSVKGRTVRPENKARIEKGEALWGSVGAPPAEKDRLAGEAGRSNLNYPAKKIIKPLREGTDRHKLVTIMRKKGVTIEDVMEMFKLEAGPAIYKLRDLHYTSGHGLVVKGGRVFVTDK